MAFVHLDVASAYSSYLSPSRPEDYVALLKEQRGTALCIADYGLHGAVRFTQAALDAGLTPILSLRVRVCAHRALRPWAEQPGELILLARNCCLMIGSDYGHADTATEIIDLQHLRASGEVDSRIVDKILCTNPARFYGLE